MGERRAIELFLRDRVAAHRVLFGHRMAEEPAGFHRELTEDFWSAEELQVRIGFRGCAKSTLVEQNLCLAVGERRFRNALVIGASERRAAERVQAVAHELDTNGLFAEAYGDQRGKVWNSTELRFGWDGRLMAMGRDQDIRGIKYLQWRPDLVVVDDFEDKDLVQTEDGRRKTLRWFLGELLPACEPHCLVRVYATAMAADSVPVRLMTLAGWGSRVYPIARRDSSGAMVSAWPAKFSDEWIETRQAMYRDLGELHVWACEYMCDPSEDESRVFTREMLRSEPRVRVWEPAYVIVDPARTVNVKTSSMTGIVAASRQAGRLVVWEDRTGFWQPEEIVRHIFELDEAYGPVEIGVEENGLEEWLRAPLRAEMLRRGRLLPLRGLRAPRSKLDFIKGLRSFELIFARPCPVLEGQLLGFPGGRIDGANALAYLPRMMAGDPVYEAFNPNVHVADRLTASPGEALYLALGATGAWSTGALLAARQGGLAVLADWVAEGDAGAAAGGIVREAGLWSRSRPQIVVGPEHFDVWHNVGLTQALRALPVEFGQGGAAARGRAYVRDLLARTEAGLWGRSFRVSSGARWTLAALSAAYAREPGKPEARTGFHRTLMEAVESCAALLSLGEPDADADWSYTPDGRRYRQYRTAYQARH